jgi:hypothetical protein
LEPTNRSIRRRKAARPVPLGRAAVAARTGLAPPLLSSAGSELGQYSSPSSLVTPQRLTAQVRLIRPLSRPEPPVRLVPRDTRRPGSHPRSDRGCSPLADSAGHGPMGQAVARRGTARRQGSQGAAEREDMDSPPGRYSGRYRHVGHSAQSRCLGGPGARRVAGQLGGGARPRHIRR